MFAPFDIVLSLAILYLAWRSLADRDLFRAVVQFIAMGMLVAVVWVRLRAPDVALAEAAVGSGLTGALMLSALARLRHRAREKNHDERQTRGSSIARGARFALALTAWLLFGCFVWAALSLPAEPRGLGAESLAALSDSGVKNPVTAVLLNYRGYDTLLEVAVLLLAIVGVWSLGPVKIETPARHTMTATMLRFVLPVLAVVAGYSLWIGAYAPGGAFQGGALAGGALVLAFLGGLGERILTSENRLRAILVWGLCVFAAVAGAALVATGGLLQYPPGGGGTWILIIESAAMISIGLTLGLMFIGGSPLSGKTEGGD